MSEDSEEDLSVDTKYTSAVGGLTLFAALTDAVLFSAFVVVSGIEVKLARAIYYTLDAIPTRKAMINRVLNISADKATKKLVHEIMQAVDKAHGPRNELAHALVLMDETTKGGMRFSPKDQQQPNRPVTEAYLRSLLDPAHEATMEAGYAYRRLCGKLGVPDKLHVG